ncbi:MAG: FAD-dependent oxidoreductase [Oscillospiraceae bacterium]|nr:FAD-dependent oxidoreductase [Oscillospiraceae bacterium]
MKYPDLFRPIQIGDTLFRNRIFSAPTGHPDVSVDGEFSEDAVAYYERKAQGGAAAVTLGEAIVDSRYGKRHPFQVSLDCRNSLHSLSQIADRIRRHGAVPSLELQHSGMKATPGIVTPGFCTGSDILYGPSAMELNGVRIQEMPEELIYEIIEKFGNAAAFLKNCGFGMVTIHAGHGWMLNQFLTSRLNRRGDRWGGSTENRAHFVVEICDAIHRTCGRGFPVEVRISASEIIEGGYDVHEGIAIAQQLRGHADIIHCSVGCGIGLPEEYRTFTLTHPCMFKEDGVNVKYAAEVKRHITDTPVAAVGAMTDPGMMNEIIASGQADIVEMARGLICDPDLPIKAREGREDEIVHCMRCLSCFSNLKDRGGFWCALNPITNRERAFARTNVHVTRKKVLVVGGGIAGMQAALTAEKKGHSVILCEKTNRLGGHITCESGVPFKKHLSEYIEQQIRRLKRSSVDVRMNVDVTPEYARQIGADVVIAALGAVPVRPDIPGIDGTNVLCADEAYADPGRVGRSAVILGAGFVGTELAIYLKSLGKSAAVLEMADHMNVSSNSLHGQAVDIKLREEKIPVFFSAKAVQIDAAGVLAETPEGPRRFDAETVVYAVGQKALSEEAAALYDCADQFYPVGDCVRPATISDANLTAMSVAQNIGRI